MPDADSTPDLSKLRIERSAPQRGGGRTGLVVLLVIMLLVTAWLAWPRLMGLSDGRPEVELGRVTKTGGPASVSGTAANGYVVARRQASLSTDIQGRLVELTVEEGDRVREGDLVEFKVNEKANGLLDRSLRGKEIRWPGLNRFVQRMRAATKRDPNNRREVKDVTEKPPQQT